MSEFDPKELFAALGRHGVRYVTIGGIAVQAHGGQRLTQDLDMAIATDGDNYARIADALTELDASLLGPDGTAGGPVPSPRLLATSEQWHFTTAHGNIDVIVLPAHLGRFDEVFRRAHRVQIGDVEVPIASRQDLIEMKRASTRPQDAADADFLESLGD